VSAEEMHTHGEGSTDDTTAPANLAPVLDRRALYGPAGDWVKLVEPHTEASTAALLMAILGFSGITIGRKRYVILDAQHHFLNIFAFFVGLTGSARKTTALAHGKRAWKRIYPEFLAQNVAHGLSSAEGLIDAVRDENPEKEITGVDDKRLLIIESELSSVFKRMNREGNAMNPTMRSIWDGESLRVMTKGSPQQATNPHIGILGAITSDELGRNLGSGDLENGLLNRFLWVHTERARLLPHGGDVPEVEEMQVLDRIAHAIAIASRDEARSKLSAAADLWWTEAYERLSTGRSGRVGAATQRGAAHVRRLAMLFAALDGVVDVDVPHLEAANHLWTYCEQSAAFVLGAPSTLSKLAAAIKEALDSAGQAGLSREDIRKQAAHNNVPAKDIKAALEDLQTRGLARGWPEKTRTKGRSREMWATTLDNTSAKKAKEAKEAKEVSEKEVSEHEPRAEASSLSSLSSLSSRPHAA
jgi:hypothetical protein